MSFVAASSRASPDRAETVAPATSQDELAVSQLTLDELKELCQVITAEMGLSVKGLQRYARHMDLSLESTVLLRPHHVLGPAEFVDLCRRSHSVGWLGQKPVPRKDTYRRARHRADALKEVDSVGLAWLPALSRNRLPWALRHSRVPADEWFERVTFRLATMVFRINGVRLGAANRGQRVGDALLWWRGRLILLDCKAAQNGYRLEVDDERRLLEYARRSYPGYVISERVECVLLVSSGFPTFELDHGRFVDRRRRFVEVGSDLACIRADDLVDAALAVLSDTDDTRAIDNVAWDRILAQGLVTRERLLRYCVLRESQR